jgi:hypothetical protein
VKTEVRRRQKCNEFCMKNEKKEKKKRGKELGKKRVDRTNDKLDRRGYLNQL